MTKETSERPSTLGLIGDAIRQATELVSTEIALVRLEAVEKLGLVVGAAISVVLAAVLILVALIFLLQGLVELLIAKGLPAFAASFAVGGGIGFFALIAALIAIRNLNPSQLRPARMIRQVETVRGSAGRRA